MKTTFMSFFALASLLASPAQAATAYILLEAIQDPTSSDIGMILGTGSSTTLQLTSQSQSNCNTTFNMLPVLVTRNEGSGKTRIPVAYVTANLSTATRFTITGRTLDSFSTPVTCTAGSSNSLQMYTINY